MTLIFLFSYYIGILWIVMCELHEDFVNDANYKTHPDIDSLDENFLTFYKLYEKDAINLVIITTYFSLTSLTTIGLGDYRPTNDLERLQSPQLKTHPRNKKIGRLHLAKTLFERWPGRA